MDHADIVSPLLRSRVFVATWAAIAAGGISFALGAFWMAVFAVMVMVAFGSIGMRDTTAAAVPFPYQPMIGAGAAVSSAVAMVVVYVATAVAIRRRSPPADAPAMSAACVTSATVLAMAAASPLFTSAMLYRVTSVTVACAMGVWCAALAGTVPRASRGWTVIFAIVFAAMICGSYVIAVKIRL
jgi:hypothetical protein